MSSFYSSYYKEELLESVVSVLETVKKHRHSRVDAKTTLPSKTSLTGRRQMKNFTTS